MNQNENSIKHVNLNKKYYHFFDLIRFSGAVGILFFHTNFVGWSWHPFMNGFVYVELFFMLSGYFLAAHFWNDNKENIIDIEEGHKDISVVVYVIKKYKKYVCYSAIPTFIIYLLIYIQKNESYSNFDSVISWFSTCFLEIIYLRIDNLINGPIWYLASMLVIMPIMCIFLKVNKNISVVICFVTAYLIYSQQGIMNQTWTPFNLFRATGGLSIGVVIYCITDMFKKVRLPKLVKWLLTSIQLFSVVYPFYYLYNNMGGGVKASLLFVRDIDYSFRMP